MKIWVDDIRSAPEGYEWCKSVNDTLLFLMSFEQMSKIYNLKDHIEVIDLDHDSGDFYFQGGDYIKILDWLEKTGRNYPIHIHSMNPVGVQNMKAIIKRNNWEEI